MLKAFNFLETFGNTMVVVVVEFNGMTLQREISHLEGHLSLLHLMTTLLVPIGQRPLVKVSIIDVNVNRMANEEGKNQSCSGSHR